MIESGIPIPARSKYWEIRELKPSQSVFYPAAPKQTVLNTIQVAKKKGKTFTTRTVWEKVPGDRGEDVVEGVRVWRLT